MISLPPLNANHACDHHAQTSPASPARMSCACLLKRVFDIDVEHCAKCGGRLKIIAAILDPALGPAFAQAAKRRPYGAASPMNDPENPRHSSPLDPAPASLTPDRPQATFPIGEIGGLFFLCSVPHDKSK
jgi:hypothetical protein